MDGSQFDVDGVDPLVPVGDEGGGGGDVSDCSVVSIFDNKEIGFVDSAKDHQEFVEDILSLFRDFFSFSSKENNNRV